MNNEMTPEDLERARGAFDRLVNDAIYQYYGPQKVAHRGKNTLA